MTAPCRFSVMGGVGLGEVRGRGAGWGGRDGEGRTRDSKGEYFFEKLLVIQIH